MADPRPTKRGGPLYWLKRRSRRFWIIAALVPVLYVASFGPACWISSRMNAGASLLPITYLPLVYRSFLGMDGINDESAVDRALIWYAEIGAADQWHWCMVPSVKSGAWELTWCPITPY